MAEKKNQTAKSNTRKSGAQTNAGRRKNASTASSSAKKSTTSRKNRSRKAPEEEKLSPNEAGQSISTAIDISLWIVLALSVLLFLGNLGLGGSFGAALSGFFFGVFGLMEYPFPVLLLIGAFFFASNRNNRAAVRTIIGCILLFLSLIILTELIHAVAFHETALDAFRYSRVYHRGGGFIGGLFASAMIPSLGLIASYIIDLIAAAVSVVLISNRSVILTLQDSREHMEEKSKVRRKEKQLRQQIHQEEARTAAQQRLADLESRRDQAAAEAAEARNKREQEREQRREASREAMRHSTIISDSNDPGEKPSRLNRKVEGINFNTDLKQPDASSSDDMHEVKINIFDDASQTQMGPIHIHGENLDEHEEAAGSSSPRNIREADHDFDDHAKIDMHNAMADADQMTPDQAATTGIVEAAAAGLAAAGLHQADKAASGDDSENSEGNVTSVGNASDVKPTIPKKPREAFQFPPVSLLKENNHQKSETTREYLEKTARKLQTTLANFGVNVTVTDVSCGPAVTRYEIQPEVGVKVSKIVNLADDIKLNLAASDIRIEAPIPGKAAVGIEVPNKEKMVVPFRDLMESREFKKSKSNIAFALGKDIAGKIVISDIAKMPHLLIAGATGSGKSVCINTIIMSILYKAHPDDVKFIMIDPKVVELSVYNGIPHLLIPVVTDPKKAAGALNWAVHEMEDRYQKFAEAGVRDMAGYNAHIKNGTMTKMVNGEPIQVPTEKMPQIIVIVDELADLMMVSSSEVEAAICRLAQLARAAGIHLVIATQRPSVNVITGLIKANMPSRIAFAVTSGVDSRTILDMVGAEKLLGKGDMLYYPQGYPKPVRVQGAFVSDEEVTVVTKYIREHNEADEADKEKQASIQEQMQSDDGAVSVGGSSDASDSRDAYFEDAGRLIIGKEKASIGMLQRAFRIGFNRAARIMDQLEEAGVVGPEEGTKPRKVLMTIDQFESLINA